MLSKSEIEFLKNPQRFDADYRRVLRHRVKAKTAILRNQLSLLEGSEPSITVNCNGVTEFSNCQQNQISTIQAPNVNRWWAEPDLNRRPLARKANVLTRLDDRPTWCWITLTALVNIRILFSLASLFIAFLLILPFRHMLLCP